MSEATELVEKYADKLVKGMGDIAPEAWEIMVRGQVVDGIIHLMWSAVFVAALAFAVKCARWGVIENKRMKCGYLEGGDGDIPIIFCTVAALLSGMFLFVNLGEAMRCIFSPEYMVLRELME